MLTVNYVHQLKILTQCSHLEDSLPENTIRSLYINGTMYWRPFYSGGKKKVPQWPAVLLELNDGADHSALRPQHELTGCRILKHSA